MPNPFVLYRWMKTFPGFIDFNLREETILTEDKESQKDIKRESPISLGGYIFMFY